MAKNVVLIGATGFVGNAILNELVSRGHKVTAIVRNMDSVKVKNDLIEYVVADATNPVELSSVPTIPAGRIHASMRKRWRTIRRLSRVQNRPVCADC